MTEVRLERGMRVRLRAEGQTCEWAEGEIILASPNGQAVAVVFDDGALRTAQGGVYVSCVPFSIDYDAQTVEDLAGERFELEVKDT